MSADGEERRRLLAIVSTLAVRLSILATGLATSVITARALGPVGRGQYYAVVSFAGLAAQVANLGLGSSNTFLAARDRSLIGRLAMNSAWIVCGFALVLGALLLLFGDALSAQLKLPPKLVGGALLLGPAMLFVTLATALLVAEERFRLVNLWQLANAGLATALLLWCVYARLEPGAYLVATTIAAVATALGLGHGLRSGFTRLRGFDLALFRQGFGYAARAYLALLAGFAMQRVGPAVLAARGDLHEVGLYSIGAQIFDVMIILPSTVALVLFPSLIRSAEGGWKSTRNALKAVMPLMLAACAVALLAGARIIPAVFGRPFADSYLSMAALLPAVLAISAVSVLSQYLVSRGFPTALVLLWAAGFAITLLTQLTLTPQWGAVGAAAGQSAGSLVVLAGAIVLSVRQARAAAPVPLPE